MERKKVFIISLSLIVFIGVAAAIWVVSSNQSANETKEIIGTTSSTASGDNDDTDSESQNAPQPEIQERTAAELNQAIITQSPSLLVDGQPNFAVTDVKRVDKQWYVVKILNTADKTTGRAWVIMKDEGDGPILVAGPGTYFPPSTPIPDSVRKAIK